MAKAKAKAKARAKKVTEAPKPAEVLAEPTAPKAPVAPEATPKATPVATGKQASGKKLPDISGTTKPVKVVLPDGSFRIYSKETNGKDYPIIAKQYAENMGGWYE